VHFHHGPQRADTLHNFEWIYLSHGFEYYIFILDSIDCMHFQWRSDAGGTRRSPRAASVKRAAHWSVKQNLNLVYHSV